MIIGRIKILLTLPVNSGVCMNLTDSESSIQSNPDILQISVRYACTEYCESG